MKVVRGCGIERCKGTWTVEDACPYKKDGFSNVCDSAQDFPKITNKRTLREADPYSES